MRLVELTILVPENRLTDFYTLFGNWNRKLKAETPEVTEEPQTIERTLPERVSSSRYQAIAQLFEGAPDTISFTFEEIEKAVGSPLPATARNHRAWWSNTNRNSQARAWMGEGFAVTGVDMDGEQVSFAREG